MEQDGFDLLRQELAILENEDPRDLARRFNDDFFYVHGRLPTMREQDAFVTLRVQRMRAIRNVLNPPRELRNLNPRYHDKRGG